MQIIIVTSYLNNEFVKSKKKSQLYKTLLAEEFKKYCSQNDINWEILFKCFTVSSQHGSKNNCAINKTLII